MTKVTYRTVSVDGMKIFYREAGPTNAPTLLLLHGFPTSSHMFRGLIPLLADRFHIVAPDLPGFGQSDLPSRDAFSYTFARSAEVIGRFTEVVSLKRFASTFLTMARQSVCGLRSSIRSVSRRSSRRTATPMRKASATAGIRSGPIGANPPRRTATHCGASSRRKRRSGNTPTASATHRSCRQMATRSTISTWRARERTKRNST